ncbi:hypothetical protein ACLOJK_030744 [Asimina triloba]
MRSNAVHPASGQASLGTSLSARRVDDSLASGGGFSVRGEGKQSEDVVSNAETCDYIISFVA